MNDNTTDIEKSNVKDRSKAGVNAGKLYNYIKGDISNLRKLVIIQKHILKIMQYKTKFLRNKETYNKNAIIYFLISLGFSFRIGLAIKI